MKKAYIITTIVTVVIAITAFLYSFLGYNSKSPNKIPKTPTPTLSPTTIPITPMPTPTPSPKLQTGIIEGSLGFPSEGIPENMVICAENTQTKENFCVSQHLKDSKYTYGIGYKIELPAGIYLVYATIPDYKEGYRAYYSEFVTCGLSINCSSHEPIVVSVSSEQTVTGIDPIDWYVQTPAG